MSAAAKLAALEQKRTQRDVQMLVAALPQIKALVEAAEQTALAYQYGAGLLEPLAALEEALTR